MGEFNQIWGLKFLIADIKKNMIEAIKENWIGFVLVCFFLIVITGGILWSMSISEKEKASQFAVSGMIESIREEHSTGLFGVSTKRLYAKIGGIEYRLGLGEDAIDIIKVGEYVDVKGNENIIDTVSVTRGDLK